MSQRSRPPLLTDTSDARLAQGAVEVGTALRGTCVGILAADRPGARVGTGLTIEHRVAHFGAAAEQPVVAQRIIGRTRACAGRANIGFRARHAVVAARAVRHGCKDIAIAFRTNRIT